MKVLLVHNSYREMGGEDVVFEQERRLLGAAGHEVQVFRRSNSEIHDDNFVRRIALAKQTIWASPSRNGLQELLRQGRPDLVHVHNTFPLISPSVFWACKQEGIPVIQTLHNYRLICPVGTLFRDAHLCEECMEHTLWRSLRYGCYRKSRLATAPAALMLAIHRNLRTWSKMVDCYIALSQFAKSKYIQSGIPANKIQVKPNFLYADPGLRDKDGGYALYAGRIIPEKGLPVVINAWRRLKVRIPLVVIGAGPLLDVMQRKVAESGLSKICFKGMMDHEGVLSAMKGARFVLFPSQYYENFPMTLVESFACGVPVIASRLGSINEIVRDGFNGLQFTPGDDVDLAAKVEWAWTHRDEMKLMGQNARLEYERKYSAPQNYRTLMSIYRSVLDNSNPDEVVCQQTA